LIRTRSSSDVWVYGLHPLTCHAAIPSARFHRQHQAAYEARQCERLPLSPGAVRAPLAGRSAPWPRDVSRENAQAPAHIDARCRPSRDRGADRGRSRSPRNAPRYSGTRRAAAIRSPLDRSVPLDARGRAATGAVRGWPTRAHLPLHLAGGGSRSLRGSIRRARRRQRTEFLRVFQLLKSVCTPDYRAFFGGKQRARTQWVVTAPSPIPPRP
jgi:hypothetical protein